MNDDTLKNIIEGALLAAGRPLTLEQLLALFEEHERPERKQVKAALDELGADLEHRGIELKQVASGYRLQVRQSVARWVSRLWEEKPPRYSRAYLETLALIAYRQPITRGEIEAIRGVSVSSAIIRSMLEHEWIKVLGHRDVPGKPALYGTTKKFLDSFNLKSLEELPSLAEVRDLSEIGKEIEGGDEQAPEQLSLQDAAQETETAAVAGQETGDKAAPDDAEPVDASQAGSEEPEAPEAQSSALPGQETEAGGDEIPPTLQTVTLRVTPEDDAEEPAAEQQATGAGPAEPGAHESGAEEPGTQESGAQESGAQPSSDQAGQPEPVLEQS